MKITSEHLHSLIVLQIVAKYNSFVKASRELHVSTSAVSQSVKNLEEKVGVALLTRTTRSVSLTEAGRLLLDQASPALDNISNAFIDVAKYSKEPSGTLRLNIPSSIYQIHIAPIVRGFLKKYPEIKMELFFEDGRTDIVANEFDAGIRISDILIQDMVAIKLFGPVKFVTIASPEYLKQHRRPKHPNELINHKCIAPVLGKGNIYNNWEFVENSKEFKIRINPYIVMNDTNLIIEEASNGSGIAYTIESIIQNDVKSGKLEIVLDKFSTYSEGFYLYYPSGLQVLPKLKAFIDYIKDTTIKYNKV